MADTELLIIGGGIVGTSTALFAAREGLDVILLEKNRIGSGASGAAAGTLVPPDYLNRSRPPEEQNPYAYFSDRSYQFWYQFLPYLEQQSDISIPFSLSGSLALALTEEEEKTLQSCKRERKKHHRISTWASGEELRSRYPFLSDQIRGGLYRGEEIRLQPETVMNALHKLLQKRDVMVVEQTEVTDIHPSETPIRIDSSRGPCTADQLLIACGSWSRHFSSMLQPDIPVRPRKGEIIRVQYELPDSAPIFRHRDRYFIPRQNHLLDVGATDEDCGFDRSLDNSSRDGLLDTLHTVFEDADNCRVMNHWAGLRPYAERKGGPFLGRLPGYDRIYIGAGHYRSGILQGPFTGKLLSSLITGKEPAIDLTPFQLQRQ